jgi:hypothetical protein
MTVHDFLNKYGTRAVSMLMRELAYRKKDSATVLEAADDLQAMLERLITHEDLMQTSMHDAMRKGMNGGSDVG